MLMFVNIKTSKKYFLIIDYVQKYWSILKLFSRRFKPLSLDWNV